MRILDPIKRGIFLNGQLGFNGLTGIPMIRAKNFLLEILGLLWYPNVSKNSDKVEEST